MKISVIIPTKNEAEYLTNCIYAIQSAIHNEAISDYEIIVVDNFSNDETVNIAKEKKCKVLYNDKKNPGSSRNKGAEIATGDYLAFIDADCIIDPHWFKYALKISEDDDNVVAVGTKAIPNFDSSSWVEQSFYHLVKWKLEKSSSDFTYVNWFGASNFLIRKTIFNMVGGFNERLTTGEDYDLSNKLLKIGKLAIDNRINTLHLREPRTLKQLYQKELWRGKNSLASWKEHSFNWREAPSIMLPALFMITLLIGIIALLGGPQMAISFLLMHGVLPLFYVLRVPNICLRPLLLAQCYAVAYTYLLSRAVALFREITDIGKR